ncbi:hypothetical protein GCM10011583_74480 [Streptomyces camponoticapitis]|uniref:Uncharacterized protein n=1 Tax=Streptomyces camponoticapitis TaxID=1616125 RepID=A0ABQ2EYY9_9ACTN|nr:hypothetical protein GCM10011583_74480 [Streptomyces camponoticapitis]
MSVDAGPPAAAVHGHAHTSLGGGTEDRTGYDRGKFKHWVEAGCRITAGQWYSYYGAA